MNNDIRNASSIMYSTLYNILSIAQKPHLQSKTTPTIKTKWPLLLLTGYNNIYIVGLSILVIAFNMVLFVSGMAIIFLNIVVLL